MMFALLLVAQTGTASAAAALGAIAGAAEAGPRLEVIVEDVEARGGNLVVSIYQDKDSWLKIDRARRVVSIPARAGRAEVAFEGLAPGEYAVAVLHDVNRNRKMDMKWFPIPGPAEGAAISNDASSSFGPPSYEAARIEIKDPKKTVHVKMRY